MSCRIAARVSVAVAIVLATIACGPSNEELPEALVGVWRTDAPRYADRYLELQPGFVTFGTGPVSMDLYALASVSSEPVKPPARGRLYTLVYTDGEGLPSSLRLIHDERNPSVLRLAHRREQWKRDATAASAPTKERRR
jgi:hypothetical protein